MFAGLLVSLTICLTSCVPGEPSQSTVDELPRDGVADGWAVLAECDEWMIYLSIDYVNVTRLHQLLVDSGWQESHIRELREFDRKDLQQALDWLAASADGDDVVLFYVNAQSSYLRTYMRWGDFFGDDWAEIPSERRVLVVDSSLAATFTAALRPDLRPYLSIASSAGDEYVWAGQPVPEKGLHIAGGVFTHYFVAAFADPESDADGNGAISVQEAAYYAEGRQRTYVHEVIFAVPEFLEDYRRLGDYHPERDLGFPHVVVDDEIGVPVYLELDER